ncbi:AAA family ATPase [Nocardioides sp.]|uniref:AAA family ATPase n=1 Tax=Nocardioides sp. TaxID=35761 RepID=UPI002EDA9C4E
MALSADPAAADVYIVVTGPPASGKSTLATALAGALGLPLLAKDTIKAGLVGALGADDVEESRRLGRAAVRAMLATARENGRGVLDSVWVDRRRAIEDLAALPGPVVEVFCRCPREVLEERYAERGRDVERPPEELWSPATRAPLEGPWPVVEVDTREPVEVWSVAERALVAVAVSEQWWTADALRVRALDTRADLAVLSNVALSTARTLAAAGVDPAPFAVVDLPRGGFVHIAPGSWVTPPDWVMGRGDVDPLEYVRHLVESTGVRHRAVAFVTVDESGTARVVAEHHADGTGLEETEIVRPPG